MAQLVTAFWIVLAVLGCVIALLAAAVLNTLIRAWADVRIAAHTGVDPRVDRAAAKAAEVRKGAGA